MKSLPIVLLAGWLYAAGSGTPVVLANDLKVADIDSCSQAGENSPSDDSAEAASTAQVSESASTSNNPGGASDLFWKWFRMGERIQADEPDWLSPLATTSGRLKQEFRALANLQHRNFVRFGELICEHDQWYFTMERIIGSNFVG